MLYKCGLFYYTRQELDHYFKLMKEIRKLASDLASGLPPIWQTTNDELVDQIECGYYQTPA